MYLFWTDHWPARDFFCTVSGKPQSCVLIFATLPNNHWHGNWVVHGPVPSSLLLPSNLPLSVFHSKGGTKIHGSALTFAKINPQTAVETAQTRIWEWPEDAGGDGGCGGSCWGRGPAANPHLHGFTSALKREPEGRK